MFNSYWKLIRVRFCWSHDIFENDQRRIARSHDNSCGSCILIILCDQANDDIKQRWCATKAVPINADVQFMTIQSCATIIYFRPCDRKWLLAWLNKLANKLSTGGIGLCITQSLAVPAANAYVMLLQAFMSRHISRVNTNWIQHIFINFKNIPDDILVRWSQFINRPTILSDTLVVCRRSKFRKLAPFVSENLVKNQRHANVCWKHNSACQVWQWPLAMPLSNVWLHVWRSILRADIAGVTRNVVTSQETLDTTNCGNYALMTLVEFPWHIVSIQHVIYCRYVMR